MTPQSPYDNKVYERNARIYKILASPQRLAILNTIRQREATVTELAKVLKMRKANVSQHFAILRHAGFVNARRDGQSTFYKIIDPRLVEPCAILKRLADEGKIR